MAALVVGGTAFRVWQVARIDDRRPVDVVVVLGAAQYDGKPSSIFAARLRHAEAPVRSGARPAHRHRRAASRAGDNFTEAEAGRRYLLGAACRRGRWSRSGRARHAGQPAGGGRRAEREGWQQRAHRQRPVALAARPDDGPRQRPGRLDLADPQRAGRADPGDPAPLHRRGRPRRCCTTGSPTPRSTRDHRARLSRWADRYTDHDRARAGCRSRPKGTGTERRSPFARDRARVLHSAALRRLAGKTQVVGPGEGAEVSGVPAHAAHPLAGGRADRPRDRRGAGLRPGRRRHRRARPRHRAPAVRAQRGAGARRVRRAACGGFEGNAQTLRILTRLEPKVDGGRAGSTSPGRRWTPRPSTRGARGRATKYGAYDDDGAVFGWVRDGRPAGAALPRGAGDGLVRRRRLLGARRRGRHPRRPDRPRRAGLARERECWSSWRRDALRRRPGRAGRGRRRAAGAAGRRGRARFSAYRAPPRPTSRSSG